MTAKARLLIKHGDAGCDATLQQLVGHAEAHHAAAYDQHVAYVVAHCDAEVPKFRSGKGSVSRLSNSCSPDAVADSEAARHFLCQCTADARALCPWPVGT